jgi:glycosyltransferase involved in cell wall biosynthesis
MVDTPRPQPAVTPTGSDGAKLSARSTKVSQRIVLLAPELFKAEGGIARISRLYLQAIADNAPNAHLSVVVLNDATIPASALARYHAPNAEAVGCNRSKWHCAKALWHATRAPKTTVVCTHIHLAPLLWAIRLMRPTLNYDIVVHGIEVWTPLSWLSRRSIAKARHVLSVSEYTRQKVNEQVPDQADKLIVLPNALDPGFEFEVASDARVPYILLTVSRLLGPAIGPIVRARGGNMWHWSQDLYPEVALAIAPLGLLSAVLGLLRPWRNQEWMKATGIVAIGTDMAERIHGNKAINSSVHVVPNWAPRGLEFHEACEQRAHWGLTDQTFIVAYAGNLGRAHVLTPLVSLAAACQTDENVRIVIVGRGAQRSHLEKLTSEQGLQNCTFLPPVARERLGACLAAADVHVITMRPDCVGTVWPSKFYGVVAAARPMVFIGPPEAEIAQIIRAHGLGVAVSPTELPFGSWNMISITFGTFRL